MWSRLVREMGRSEYAEEERERQNQQSLANVGLDLLRREWMRLRECSRLVVVRKLCREAEEEVDDW